jgi:hypothetical protein
MNKELPLKVTFRQPKHGNVRSICPLEEEVFILSSYRWNMIPSPYPSTCVLHQCSEHPAALFGSG